jgi:GTPase SAR1 family protein
MDHFVAKRSIELVLASHTNIGKTSLARTLLGRDVGDVRDEAHVTQFSDRYTWQEAAQGESLKLWDTPGFGDSQRLLKRLRKSGTLSGWLLTEVWDRWLHPGFHFSQKVLRTVQDEADVVLYLVSAAEPPETAAYLDSEMQLLECIEKPVIVLINQLASDQDMAQEAADIQQWQQFCKSHPHIVSVLPLDAFARCWVQEFVLLEAIQTALQEQDSCSLMGRLIVAWQTDGLQVFEQSMQVLANCVARCAVARQPVADSRSLGAVARGLMKKANAPKKQQGAERALSKAMTDDTEQALAELAKLYRLDATVENDIAGELGHFYHPKKGVSETRFTLLGAVLTGMLSGLAADIAVGGLSLGSGMIIGGIAGAAGGKAAAFGYNRVAGTADSWVEWDADALDALVVRIVMGYLIIAHAGRGRGKSVLKREHPRWLQAVPQAVAAQHDRLLAIWGTRGTGPLALDTERRIEDKLLPLITQITWGVLETLYPHVTKLREPSENS